MVLLNIEIFVKDKNGSFIFREEFDTIDSNDTTNLIEELVIASDLRKVCLISFC